MKNITILRKKSNKGITLIALIVTIIVLLILAGIVIATLTGENGILTKAQKAATKYNKATEDELEILDKYANMDIESDEEIYGIWRISKNTKNYAPNKLTLNIKSIYHDDSILTLNEYKEKYIAKKFSELIPPVEDGYEITFSGFVLTMIVISEELQPEDLIKLGFTEDNIFQIDRKTLNKFLKNYNLGTKEEMLYDNFLGQWDSLNDYADALLKLFFHTDENILEIEKEYEQYVQNYETNINLPEEIKNKKYIFTYTDGSTEEIMGKQLDKYEKNFDISENGKQIINIEESNENQEIEIEVKNIIKTTIDDYYKYTPYSKGYAVKVKDNTLTSYIQAPKVQIDNIPINSMSKMFSDCKALTNLDLSNFDTSKVTDMSNMFYNCSALTNLDISSFDTSKVKKMSRMFEGCSALNSILVGERWIIQEGALVTDMFKNCGVDKVDKIEGGIKNE